MQGLGASNYGTKSYKGFEMYKATRELINARQKFTDWKMMQVSVKKIGGGLPNECYGNAFDMMKLGHKLVSGWLVHKYRKDGNFTEIVQHWWNIDGMGRHFDTTPLPSEEYEYVVDTDIAEFAHVNYESVSSCVCSSLMLKNGKFFAIDMNGEKPIARIISNLKVENLFKYEIEGEYLMAA